MNIVVGTVEKGIGIYEKKCRICGRKIYLLEKYSDKNIFICLDCFIKIYDGKGRIVITEKTAKIFNKIYKTNLSKEELKKLVKYEIERSKPCIAG
jgi:hypothetical protein